MIFYTSWRVSFVVHEGARLQSLCMACVYASVFVFFVHDSARLHSLWSCVYICEGTSVCIPPLRGCCRNDGGKHPSSLLHAGYKELADTKYDVIMKFLEQRVAEERQSLLD